MDYQQNTRARGSGRNSSSPGRRQVRSASSARPVRNTQNREIQKDASSRRSAGASSYDVTTSAVRAISTREVQGASRGTSRPTYEQMRARRTASQARPQGSVDRQRPARPARTAGTGRTSLRRETVSSFGYEPGQSSRPFSYSGNNPIQEGFSLGIDSGKGADTSWRSRGRRVPSVPQGRNWKPIIAAAAGLVLAVIIVSMIFGH